MSLLFIILIVLVVVMLICLFEWWKRLQQGGVKMPPRCPQSWPVIGISLLFFRIRDTKCLLKLVNLLADSCHQAGGVMYAYLGPILIYAVTDPDDCRTVLTTCLEKKFVYNLGKRAGGDGLVTTTDNLTLWRRHRKIISRAFNQQVLDNYLDTFNTKSKQLVRSFAQKINVGHFDHFSLLVDISMGILYQTTMGFEDDETFDNIRLEHNKIIGSVFNIISMRFRNLWMHIDLLYSFTSLKKKEDQALTLLNSVSDLILQKQREILNSTGRKSTRAKSFLDLLLELPPEDAFSDQEMRDEVINLMVAGSETTATTLTFALILLGSHQDLQEDVYKELKTVFGDSNRDVEKEDLSKLVLLDAVLMETIRLYPILPILPRYVSEDVQLKNYTLRAGTTCVVFAQHVNLNADLWGEDSKRFRPQRWIEGVSPAAAHAFTGFSIGKRSCIGKTNAMMTMKTTLAHVLRHYRIDADATKLELQLELLLKPASGCEIAVLPRK